MCDDWLNSRFYSDRTCFYLMSFCWDSVQVAIWHGTCHHISLVTLVSREGLLCSYGSTWRSPETETSMSCRDARMTTLAKVGKPSLDERLGMWAASRAEESLCCFSDKEFLSQGDTDWGGIACPQITHTHHLPGHISCSRGHQHQMEPARPPKSMP